MLVNGRLTAAVVRAAGHIAGRWRFAWTLRLRRICRRIVIYEWGRRRPSKPEKTPSSYCHMPSIVLTSKMLPQFRLVSDLIMSARSSITSR
jgi:hypothetical protein